MIVLGETMVLSIGTVLLGVVSSNVIPGSGRICLKGDIHGIIIFIVDCYLQRNVTS
jgi:TM2 domain-containing membrane protein YozV